MSDQSGWSAELGVVSVAAPCPARWAEMIGDEVVRFCGHCRLNVYNLSELAPEEARRLLIEREGKLCVRFYRRADGTLITRDCPVGLAARLRRKLWAMLAAALALVATVVRWPGAGGDEPVPGPPPPLPIPHAPVAEKPKVDPEKWIEARRGQLPRQQVLMGGIRQRIEVIREK